MECPRCRSTNIVTTPVTNTIVEDNTKGFGWITACLMTVLIGPLGWLCGFCGMGEGTRKMHHVTTMVNICQDCGNQF